MQKKESFLKQIFHLAAGTMINMIIGALTVPIITRLVDPNEYGQLSLFNTYSSIALMVFTLGLDLAFVRYFYVEREKKFQKKLLGFCVGLPLILAIFGSVVIFLLNATVPHFLGFDDTIIWCFIVNFFILILNRFGMLVLRLQYKTALYSAMNILHNALYVALVIPFVILLKRNHLYICVFATLFSVFVSTGICIISERDFWFKRAGSYTLPVSKKEIVQFGFPLMIASGVFLLFQATDKFCVKYYGSYSDVGVYSSAQNLILVFSIIKTTFSTLWTPKAIEHYEADPQDRSFYVRMNQIITVVLFVFGSCVLLCKDLFVLLLGEKYREAAAILPFLMFNPIMYTVSETTVMGLSITKHTSCQVIITGISAVVNLIGNMLLIPILGPKGAAVSTGLSYILFFALRTAFSNHYFPIDFKLKKFYLMTLIFAAGCFYHMFHSFDFMIVVIFVINIACVCLLYRDTMQDIVVLGKRQLIKLKNTR